MSFPADYPFNPPTFRFNNDFYHPNGKEREEWQER
jgi:ubiquitin-conjugating enzyme E2 R